MRQLTVGFKVGELSRDCFPRSNRWVTQPAAFALERRLSGRPYNAAGGDSPAWSNQRGEYRAPPVTRRHGTVPYAELHCHSNFSFLDGASHPEEPVEEAARLGLSARAITDHGGFYGIVRFAEAAKAPDAPTIFGGELTLDINNIDVMASIAVASFDESAVVAWSDTRNGNAISHTQDVLT